MDTLWYAFGMGTYYGMGTYCMCTLGMGTLPNGYRKHIHLYGLWIPLVSYE